MTARKSATPTQFKRVEEVFLPNDEFLSLGRVTERSQVEAELVVRVLCELKRFSAIDAIGVGGSLWWFATPESDRREKKKTPARRREKLLPLEGVIKDSEVWSEVEEDKDDDRPF